MNARTLTLTDVLLDESLQVRQRLDDDTVERYREVLDDLPPVLVYDITGKLFLTDGFHRFHAFFIGRWCAGFSRSYTDESSARRTQQREGSGTYRGE